MVKIFFGIHRMIRLIHWTFASFLLEKFWRYQWWSDPGVIHKRLFCCCFLTEFLFCLFPELSPWGHSTETFQNNYLGGVGGGGGRASRERACLGKGVKAQRDEGTRTIQQDLAQPLAGHQLAYPGPRDPTACWKEEFPKGNQGRSSILSRIGKHEKGKRSGLVWSAVWE